MIKLILLMLLIGNAIAKDKAYSFGEYKIIFRKVDGFYVNRNCLDKKCEAFEKATIFYNSPLSSEQLKGGKNPSAVRCKLLMGGKVVIGQDRKGNEQSACEFKDGSFLL